MANELRMEQYNFFANAPYDSVENCWKVWGMTPVSCFLQQELSNFYPVRIRAAGLCVWSCRFVYYICMSTKNRLFSALPLENLLLSVICCLLFDFKCLQYGLLRPHMIALTFVCTLQFLICIPQLGVQVS